MTHSINQFADIYHISRPRLTRLIEDALRTHSGVFGLEGFGYFRASRPAPKAAYEIDQYYPSTHEQEEVPLHPLDGRAPRRSASLVAGSTAAPAQPPALPASDEPTDYALNLRLKQEKIEQLRQKNILEQARLREETVSYCSAAIQLLLSGLRSELNDLRLPHESNLAIRTAIANTLSDLASILPDIVAGTPVDRLELLLSTRRAARITAERAATPSE